MGMELERISKNDACRILIENPQILKIEAVSPVKSKTLGHVIHLFCLDLSMAGKFIFECSFIVDKVDEGIYETGFSNNAFALLHDFLEVKGDGYSSKIRFTSEDVQAALEGKAMRAGARRDKIWDREHYRIVIFKMYDCQD